MEDSSAADITKIHTVQFVQSSAMYSETVHAEGSTVHAEGTTKEVLKLPTDTEVPSHNTV